MFALPTRYLEYYWTWFQQSYIKHCIILPRTIADYISRRYPCDLRVVVDPGLANERFGLAVPRSSGLRPQLNRALRQLIGDQFIARTYARWMLDDSECRRRNMAAAYVTTSGLVTRRVTSSTVAVAVISSVIAILHSSFACENLFFSWRRSDFVSTLD